MKPLSDINQALSICHKHKVKVYPVFSNYRWYIEVDRNGKKKRYPKELKGKEVNEAVSKTYQFLAEKL